MAVASGVVPTVEMSQEWSRQFSTVRKLMESFHIARWYEVCCAGGCSLATSSSPPASKAAIGLLP